jgi:hypothetical protein
LTSTIKEINADVFGKESEAGRVMEGNNGWAHIADKDCQKKWKSQKDAYAKHKKKKK